MPPKKDVEKEEAATVTFVGMEWSRPPTKGYSGIEIDFVEIDKACRERQGEWACIAKFSTTSPANTLAAAIRNNRTELSSSDFEVTSRKLRDAEGQGVWVRYSPAALVSSDAVGNVSTVDDDAHATNEAVDES